MKNNGLKVTLTDNNTVQMEAYQENLSGPIHLIPIALSSSKGLNITDHIICENEDLAVVLAEHDFKAGKLNPVLEYSAGMQHPWSASVLPNKTSFLSVHIVSLSDDNLKFRPLADKDINMLKKSILFRKGGNLWFSTNSPEKIQIMLEIDGFPLLEEINPKTSGRQILLSESSYDEYGDRLKVRKEFLQRYPHNINSEGDKPHD